MYLPSINPCPVGAYNIVWDEVNKTFTNGRGDVIRKSTNPQPGDVYVNSLLTNYIVGEFGDPNAPTFGVLGRVPVQLQSGIIPKWSREDSLRAITEVRTPGIAPNQVGIGTDNTATYSCKQYGLEMVYTPEVLANASGGPYNVKMAYARALMMAAMRRRETSAVALYQGSGWTGSSTGSDITVGTQWSADGSTPVKDVEAQKLALLRKGIRATHMLINPDVRTALKTNADVLARYRAVSTAPGKDAITIVQDADLDIIFGLKVLVSEVVINSATPGATISTDFLAGRECWIGRILDGTVVMDATAASIFEWVNPELYAGGVGGMRIVEGIDQRSGSMWMQIHDAFDAKLVSAHAGVRMTAVVAAP